jgi:hypothetical protein
MPHLARLCKLAALLLLATWAAAQRLDAASLFSSEAQAMDQVAELGLLAGGADPCGAALPPAFAADALKRGWFLLAESLSLACAETSNDKLAPLMNEAASSMRSSLTRVLQIAATAKGAKQALEPAFQWAQSASAVFVNVKFAHKLDAPACIDLFDQKHQIEDAKIHVFAACKDKTFALELDLFADVNAANSSFALTSVGRGTFTLNKNVPRRWTRLLRQTGRPKNMHIWFEKQELYDAELDALPEPSDKAAPVVAEAEAAGGGAAPPEQLTWEAKVEADRARVRAMAQAKRNEVEKLVNKQKGKIADESELRQKQAELSGQVRVNKVNEALNKDLDAIEESRRKLLQRADGAEYRPLESPALAGVPAAGDKDEL